jgi:hypothetical protein
MWISQPPSPPKEEIPPPTSNLSRPQKTLNINAIGPLARTDRGHTHLLVGVDCFSYWIEILPVKETEFYE